jgi:hypothetical protein
MKPTMAMTGNKGTKSILNTGSFTSRNRGSPIRPTMVALVCVKVLYDDLGKTSVSHHSLTKEVKLSSETISHKRI